MKTFRRNNRIPFFIWFLLYWYSYNLILGAFTTVVVLVVVELIGHQPARFCEIWMTCDLFWAWLPFLFPIVYYKVASMIDSVQIDEENKTIQFIYYPFIFWKKIKKYNIEEIDVQDIDIAESRNSSFYYLLQYLQTSSFSILEHQRHRLIFRDVCGWKKEQLREICEILQGYGKKSTANIA